MESYGAYVKLSYTDSTYISMSPRIKLTWTGTLTDWRITYVFGSQSGTITELTSETDFSSFWWPSSFYNEIPTATEGKGTIIIECWKNGAFMGEDYFPFTVKVAEGACSPTISVPSVMDLNNNAIALTGNNSKLIRYISTAAIDCNVESRKAAYLRSASVRNSGRNESQSWTGDRTFASFYKEIPSVENGDFLITTTDSRGLTTTITYKIADEKFIPYVKLTCNTGNELPDTDGNLRLTCSGNYYTGQFSETTSNTLVVQYRYKEKDGTFSAWQPMTISSASNNRYNAYVSISGLDYLKTYVFECQAADACMTVSSAEKTARATPVFHWGENDFTFEVPVTFNAGISVPSDESEPAISGEWTPTLTTAAAVSSYSTQRGWYVKVGNVVTVGFNIAVSCKSGYNSTALAISGLPFTPAASAFGGGVMFGAYVNAGFCFEGWAAATNGQITPRLQPCNNTSASNLQISSTAYYPSGANSMTLGGTITYITN